MGRDNFGSGFTKVPLHSPSCAYMLGTIYSFGNKVFKLEFEIKYTTNFNYCIIYALIWKSPENIWKKEINCRNWIGEFLLGDQDDFAVFQKYRSDADDDKLRNEKSSWQFQKRFTSLTDLMYTQFSILYIP